MAVSVDKVYQKVLALANKEQRGYVTPQEFNLFADQVQMDIFEQYFYDLNKRQQTPGNDSYYADITTNIQSKISMFEVSEQSVSMQSGSLAYLSNDLSNFYRLANVKVSYIKNGYGFVEAEEVTNSGLQKYEKSPLAKPNKRMPIYTKFSTSQVPVAIKIYPHAGSYTNPISGNITSDSLMISYIRKPKSPNWTYVIGTNKNALYNPSAADHQDFELHASEETNIVIKILQLAGISIKDVQLASIAAQEDIKNIQQENK